MAGLQWRHVPIDTGGVVGRYVLGRRLGAGGMGVVYEAAGDDTPVAIKLPYCETLDDEHAARRFRDEGIAGSIVEHPNLVRVEEHGETATGIPFLVMQRVDGERLSAIVAREGTLSLRRAALLVRQILAGLAALHDAGVVHADVKSDNVLVTSDGRVLLIDFGLAHPEIDPFAPYDDLVSGTPEYMAPEVIRGDGSTTLSDLYSAGTILYELITGTTPFAGGSSAEIVARQVHDDVVPPSLRAARDVPASLEREVMRALAKDPSRRHANAATFAAALAAVTPPTDDAVAPRAHVAREAKTHRFARGTRR